MSRLSLDAGNDLSQSFGLRWAQIALLVFRKQKYQMNSSRVRQIKIDVSKTPALPSASLRVGDSAFPRVMQPSHNRPPLRIFD
jgi:hypothetical protein